MPFNINYSPVASLVQAAQAAGTSQAQQKARALALQDLQHSEDLRFRQTQLAQAGMLQDQEMQLKERAMQLQEAAQARIANTPTSLQERKDLIAEEVKGRIALHAADRAAESEDQQRDIAALNDLRDRGVVNQDAYEMARTAIMVRGPSAGVVMKALDERQQKTSQAGQYREATDRAHAADALDQISKELNRQDLSPDTRASLARQMIQVSGEATKRWGMDWKAQPQARDYKKTKPDMGPGAQQSYPLPADRSDLKVGRTYYNPTTGDILGVWTGTRFRTNERLPAAPEE